ncbi:MAG: tRNA lysidine(34) synthetase TilS [Bacteroidales bacterium]
MNRAFINYIRQHDLVKPNSPILVAVSGGVDSMVMLNLFYECGYPFSVVHCNFSLRDSESDADEQLVRDTCKKLGKKVFVKKFNTVKYASQHNISIQVAARNLRYDYFKELCSKHGFQSVAVAHNKNDIAETILINLSRASGLKGLTGIKPFANGIVRPLLFAYRKQINQYAQSNGIIYREDTSNSNIKYARNRIRHRIIPEFEKISDGVIDSLCTTSQHLNTIWQGVDVMNRAFKEKARTVAENEVHYSIQKLLEYPFRQVFLLEELTNYGFSPALILDIEKSLSSQSGKVFYADNYQLIRDREKLILSPLSQEELPVVKVNEDTTSINEPLELVFELHAIDGSFEIPSIHSTAALDFDKLTFPLTIRPWHDGDWFVPLGMKGRKKISDFLIDQKVPLHQKKRIYVIESNGNIVWVIGYRIDNRYCINSRTTKALVVKMSR